MRRQLLAAPVWMLMGALLLVTPASADESGWLLRQADLEVARLTGTLPESDSTYQQSAMGGATSGRRSTRGPAIPLLMSLVLPGSGELYLGHKRGLLQIALDVGAWYGAAHHDGLGKDKELEYYAFADAHWSQDKLEAAYDVDYASRPDANADYIYMSGTGLDYFNTEETPINWYTDLPLWVSVIDDRREYYENLGKWDQFVFGWDDFQDPRDFLGLDENDIDIANLQHPGTSENREIYRSMRKESNDHFSKRDRFIYASVAFRLFSVLQVAYLEGLLFGDGGGGGTKSDRFSIGDHQVDFFAEPVGLGRGVVGATVSF